jgi:hypothetical protein
MLVTVIFSPSDFVAELLQILPVDPVTTGLGV